MLITNISCLENSVDLDKLASKPADLDLHCFPFACKWHEPCKLFGYQIEECSAR